VGLEPVEIDAGGGRLDLLERPADLLVQQRQGACRCRGHGAPPEGGATVTMTIALGFGHYDPGLKFAQFFSSSGFCARHCAAARSRICAAAEASPWRPSTSCCAGALPFRSTCGGKKFCSQICCPVVLNWYSCLSIGSVIFAVSNRSSAGGVPVCEYQLSIIAGVCRNIRKSAASFWCFDQEVTKYDVDCVAL